MRPFCRGGQPDVDQLVQLLSPFWFGRTCGCPHETGVLPPERPIHHFRIVNLRSLYSRDRWPPPRPALTIFVRLMPRLLDPVHGPINKCKTVLWLGLVWLTVRASSHRGSATGRQKRLSCSTDNATRHDCKDNDARRRGEGVGFARAAARCSSGEATPQQRPSQDGCIDARGPPQRRDCGTRAVAASASNAG